MTSEDTAKVPRARDGEARRGALGYKAAAARRDGQRIGCGCPILRDVCEGWVPERLWRVHKKEEETAAGLKAPFETQGKPTLHLNRNASAIASSLDGHGGGK
jgi:hypothetical protein